MSQRLAVTGTPGHSVKLAELFCFRVYERRILLVGRRPFSHIQTLLLETLSAIDKKSYRYNIPESGSRFSIYKNRMDGEEQPLNLPFNLRDKSHFHGYSSSTLTRLFFSLSDTLYDVRDQR
jgi:hypothetical protein